MAGKSSGNGTESVVRDEGAGARECASVLEARVCVGSLGWGQSVGGLACLAGLWLSQASDGMVPRFSLRWKDIVSVMLSKMRLPYFCARDWRQRPDRRLKQ